MNIDNLQAVKGLQGYWHATDGSWSDSKLTTICGSSISPNYRRSKPNGITCLKCRRILRKERLTQKHSSIDTCPECKGNTIEFKGYGLDAQYKICSRYKEAGHLSEQEIQQKIVAVRQATRPSGRWA